MKNSDLWFRTVIRRVHKYKKRELSMGAIVGEGNRETGREGQGKKERERVIMREIKRENRDGEGDIERWGGRET